MLSSIQPLGIQPPGLQPPKIQPSVPALPGAPGAAQPADGAASFKNMLLDSIKEVNSMQQQADKAVESMVTGGDVNPAEVLTAVQKADLAFRTMMQIRNKLSQAYDEIKNIRV